MKPQVAGVPTNTGMDSAMLGRHLPPVPQEQMNKLVGQQQTLTRNIVLQPENITCVTFAWNYFHHIIEICYECCLKPKQERVAPFGANFVQT